VLDAVKGQSRTAHALMMWSQIESLDGSNLVLAFSSQSLATRFAADVAPTLARALTDVVGVELRVNAVAAGTPARPTSAPTESASPSDPVVDMTPDDIAESEDLDDNGGTDSEAAALALLQDGLGAQVIGEIDQS
jgi:hypothetical protein